MIPKLGWRFVAPGINPNEAALQALGLNMYCIERKDAPGQWTQELCFKTEFKAFVHARTKSLATMGTYRVVESLFKEEVLRLCRGQQVDVSGDFTIH